MEKIIVYYACPDVLFDITATSIYSLLDNTKSFVSIYILDTKISFFNKTLLEKELKRKFNNFEIHFVENNDIENIFAGCNTWNHYLDCWARFLFMDKVNVARAIYLDSDTIVLDDIEKIWSLTLEDKVIGACYDSGCGLEKSNINHTYFGSGLLLIDCEKWRKQDITNKIIEAGKKYGKEFHFPDQDALNFIFNNNNYKQLPNYLCSLGYDTESCIVRHFAGIKPWSRIFIPNYNEFWYYAELTPFIYSLKRKIVKTELTRKTYYKLFNLFTIIKIKRNWVYLFGIPIVRIKRNPDV
ncbi:MAG: hypothetical protein LBH46_00625 [Rickettsiales bacterium]|jgi:lipopolysaccharide biosynthesis glycosyltransferase|nr:hypothetical protein [Rickettsiales bacterium]